MGRDKRWGCCLGGCLLALFSFIAGLFHGIMGEDDNKRHW